MPEHARKSILYEDGFFIFVKPYCSANMRKKANHIPVNRLPEGTSQGIMLMRESFDGSPNSEQVERAHRDGGYTFIIQERGITNIEIDFQKYAIAAPALIYINPHQVHRIINFEDALISTWIITEENLRPEYLHLLEDLMPVEKLPVKPEILVMLSEMVALSIKISERKTELLHHAILKESVNTMVALIISQYLASAKPIQHHTRFDIITRDFRKLLEQHFKVIKTPAHYAGELNISTSYLNECVKAITGRSVSSNIHQRVMLEAKRLLYHSARSVKEIAGELGYDDYSYFTRLFTKVVGMTPIAFRDKNRE